MADQFFLNVLPDFVPEASPSTIQERQDAVSFGDQDSLTKLLTMPYAPLSERFKRASLDLKETIAVSTWGLPGQHIRDFTLYCGVLGTAFLLFKSYQVTDNKNDLNLSSQIIKACDSASLGSRDVTFICGRAGVCALGAVVAKHIGDEQSLRYYLSQFEKIKLTNNLPDELLYGRVGFLWACLFLNKHLGQGTIPSTYTAPVVDEIIRRGRAMGRKGTCPLMFEWYGEKYWGAAHGLAGILHVLMDMELKPHELEDVKGTLKYMINNRFASGNYPATEEDRKRDLLVHWCHGAPGIALTLVKAAKVFGDKEFLDAAVNAAEVVWNRGLLKELGSATALVAMHMFSCHSTN